MPSGILGCLDEIDTGFGMFDGDFCLLHTITSAEAAAQHVGERSLRYFAVVIFIRAVAVDVAVVVTIVLIRT